MRVGRDKSWEVGEEMRDKKYERDERKEMREMREITNER